MQLLKTSVGECQNLDSVPGQGLYPTGDSVNLTADTETL